MQICLLLIFHTEGRLIDYLIPKHQTSWTFIYFFLIFILSYCFVLTLFTPHLMFCCAMRVHSLVFKKLKMNRNFGMGLRWTHKCDFPSLHCTFQFDPYVEQFSG
jgi:hypothetical protein